MDASRPRRPDGERAGPAGSRTVERALPAGRPGARRRGTALGRPRGPEVLALLEAGEVAQRVPGAACVAEPGAVRAQAQRPETHIVRIAEQLSDDQPATGPQDPRQLPQGRLLIGDLAEHRD